MLMKVKDIELNNIKLIKAPFNENLIKSPFNENLINISYNNKILEFQTPKVIIDDILTENDKNYLILKIYPTQASKIFYNFLNEFEKHISSIYSKEINCIFKQDTFKIKIPFKFAKPVIKIYKDDSLFNYYHLCKGMEIICLVNLSKLWITENIYYNLSVNEILITKS